MIHHDTYQIKATYCIQFYYVFGFLQVNKRISKNGENVTMVNEVILTMKNTNKIIAN